jgi:hypothetical protein
MVAGDGAADDRSAAAWFTVEPDAFHLDPGKTQTLKVTVQAPSTIASGGYYAKILVTTGATQPRGSSAGVAAQLGVNYLITVHGKDKLVEKASVTQFSPFYEADGRVGFRANVQNDGNIHVAVDGAVELSDSAGKAFGTLKFPDATTILPGTSRLLEAQGSFPLKPGAQYGANVTLTYGDKNAPLTTMQTFTFAPPKIEVAAMSVCENLDRGPTLTVHLADDGDLGIVPAVQLAVQNADGSVIDGGSVPNPPLLWPKTTAAISTDFPRRLLSGSYIFVVTTQSGPDPAVSTSFPFQIGGVGGSPVPLCT